MKSTITRLLLTLFAGFILPVLGQQTGDTASKVSLPFRLITLESNGVTVGEFMKTLAKHLPAETNYVIAQGIEDTLMPNIQVKNVRVGDLLISLSNTSSMVFETNGPEPDDQSGKIATIITVKLQPGEKAGKKAERFVVETFSAGEIIERMGEEAVMSLIRSVQQERTPELSFHRPTGVIIAKGGKESLEEFSKILATLTEAAKHAPIPATTDSGKNDPAKEKLKEPGATKQP